MKDCLNPEILAGLVLGAVTGAQRRRMLAHVAGCTRCRDELRVQAAVVTTLGSVQIESKRVSSLNPTPPDPRLARDLKTAITREFVRLRARKRRLQQLIEKLVEPIFAFGQTPEPGLSTLAFRTRHGHVLARSAEVRRQTERELGLLLEALLDPALPSAVRLEWLTKLNGVLSRLGARAEPSTETRGSTLASARSSPPGPRRRSRRLG